MLSPMSEPHPHQQPLLLLDVDGVLQPLGRSIPPGYRRFTSPESEVVLCPDHGRWITELSDSFEVTWVTTWGRSANQAIGAVLGLPTLTHVELGTLPRTGTRKLDAVRAFVRGRACAWVDDEIYEDAVAWAARRAAPTLLIRTAPSVGFTVAHVEQLKGFADALHRVGTKPGIRSSEAARGSATSAARAPH